MHPGAGCSALGLPWRPAWMQLACTLAAKPQAALTVTNNITVRFAKLCSSIKATLKPEWCDQCLIALLLNSPLM